MSDPARLLLPAIRLDRESAERATERALRQVEEGVGGFLLFGGGCDEVRALSARLRAAADRPLWLAADLERGAGQQFAGAATLPPPAALAAHPRPLEAVRLAARLTALEARALGVNWVLAPVLDLDVEARNPIVGTRSFGADPDRVAELGRAWIEACQGLGVASCAKHFPGHGRTTGDSHAERPVVAAPRSTLEADLAPFRAVAGAVASVMTAHVAFPALGCDGPATLSPGILGKLLREELGFEGLVVTDALIMAGVAGDGETGAATQGWRAVRALRAGCDLLLYPSDPSLTARTLRQAAGADPRLAERVEASLARSRAALEAFGGRAARGASGDEAAPGAVGTDLPTFRPEDPAITALAEACVRRVGRERASMDGWLERARRGRIRVACLSDDGEAGAATLGEAIAAELARRGVQVERSAGPGRGAGANRAARRPSDAEGESRSAPLLVLVEATPRAWKGRAGLGEEAAARLEELLCAEGPVLPVVLGPPRVLEERGLAGLCAWASEPVMERGVAAWLAGRIGGPGS
jgi:beta-glucosidase